MYTDHELADLAKSLPASCTHNVNLVGVPLIATTSLFPITNCAISAVQWSHGTSHTQV